MLGSAFPGVWCGWQLTSSPCSCAQPLLLHLLASLPSSVLDLRRKAEKQKSLLVRHFGGFRGMNRANTRKLNVLTAYVGHQESSDLILL